MSVVAPTESGPEKIQPRKSDDARGSLRWVALFLGELRDGLTMINMQSAFLITSKNYSDKQAGILFFVFGMSQFLFQTPAGYLMDYSDRKVLWLGIASVGTTCLTIITAAFAEDNGGNMGLMVFIKFLQGAITAVIPPGLNSITQGVVGAVGMTNQVSRNEMMNHLGTAVIVLSGSLIAFSLYPNIGLLFIVSPIACAGVIFFLSRIKPHQIDHNAARGLVIEAFSEESASSNASLGNKKSAYKPPVFDSEKVLPKRKLPHQTKPSFNFGCGESAFIASEEKGIPRADTPLHNIRDPTLVTFTLICFLFHTSNACILPLVMQSLAVGGGRTGILLSGMCIIIAQVLMVVSAKICGDYSGFYGRKPLFLIGLFTVFLRCLILTFLITIRDTSGSNPLIQSFILSTQLLDGVGAGTFGTMYILVTSDISGGTGRFSFTLGITTAAMSIGGTVSGYLGEALAQDLGYREAFIILGLMSLIPALLYMFCMPETLPSYDSVGSVTEKVNKLTSIANIIEEDEENSTEKKKTSGNYVQLN